MQGRVAGPAGAYPAAVPAAEVHLARAWRFSGFCSAPRGPLRCRRQCGETLLPRSISYKCILCLRRSLHNHCHAPGDHAKPKSNLLMFLAVMGSNGYA